MFALRVACKVILVFVSIYILATAITTPYEFENEKLEWYYFYPQMGSILLLAIGAALVLAWKPYAWWLCVVVLVVYLIFQILDLALPLILFTAVLLTVFAKAPPWKWKCQDRAPSYQNVGNDGKWD